MILSQLKSSFIAIYPANIFSFLLQKGLIGTRDVHGNLDTIDLEGMCGRCDWCPCNLRS